MIRKSISSFNMKKYWKIYLLLFVTPLFIYVAPHRFYSAIFQINFEKSKKRVEITARIFIDDLNQALKKKYNKEVKLGSNKESKEDVEFLKKYLTSQVKININGKPTPLEFVSKEEENNNVTVCYLKIKEISKITTFEIENKILIDLFPEQQNIIQFQNGDKKRSLLLTSETTRGIIK